MSDFCYLPNGKPLSNLKYEAKTAYRNGLHKSHSNALNSLTKKKFGQSFNKLRPKLRAASPFYYGNDLVLPYAFHGFSLAIILKETGYTFSDFQSLPYEPNFELTPSAINHSMLRPIGWDSDLEMFEGWAFEVGVNGEAVALMPSKDGRHMEFHVLDFLNENDFEAPVWKGSLASKLYPLTAVAIFAENFDDIKTAVKETDYVSINEIPLSSIIFEQHKLYRAELNKIIDNSERILETLGAENSKENAQILVSSIEQIYDVLTLSANEGQKNPIICSFCFGQYVRLNDLPKSLLVAMLKMTALEWALSEIRAHNAASLDIFTFSYENNEANGISLMALTEQEAVSEYFARLSVALSKLDITQLVVINSSKSIRN
ncbi:hypothetical protein [Vibrio sp. D431a]|uniref:hypothetical protein n=1 Tax=Vibrio sp. D431a TaxID=2837388 RepID=UPI0025548800|nr:hypothetical protein [Vibrio sp. D431a]MDK9789874.1 hypothetical protein [Vibrio sp. D431a]